VLNLHFSSYKLDFSRHWVLNTPICRHLRFFLVVWSTDRTCWYPTHIRLSVVITKIPQTITIGSWYR
jgi:hypothetical protein